MISAAEILQGGNPHHSWAGRYPTRSGEVIDLQNPESLVVRMSDIAYGLGYQYRYGGHINPAITVAEHSILVSDIAVCLWGAQWAVPAFLHDCCEAYGHDIRLPIKRNIWWGVHRETAVKWNDLEDRITDRVYTSLGLDPKLAHAPEVRAADVLACVLEKSQSVNFADQDWGLPPLPAAIQHMLVKSMSPEHAVWRFCERWQQFGLPLVGTV